MRWSGLILSFLLVLHSSAAHADHQQGVGGRKMMTNQQEYQVKILNTQTHQIKNDKTLEAKTREMGDKDEKKKNAEATNGKELMYMMHKDYARTSKRKPPKNNHNHNN